MTNAAERWLEPRLVDVPPALAQAVRDALSRVSRPVAPEEVPDFLADAALNELDDVLASREGRERGALRLLAADAILTWAFEAVTTLGTDARVLATRLGMNGELGDRLRVARGPAASTPAPAAPTPTSIPGAE